VKSGNPPRSRCSRPPIGGLDRKATINASWRSEGLVTQAWALLDVSMPRVYEICEPSEIANAIGFLQPREETALFAPHVREAAEIEGCADTYLTLHWRLRQWSLNVMRRSVRPRCSHDKFRLVSQIPGGSAC
jgi:hypothetical protein